MKKIISILTLGAVSITVGSNASALSYSDNVGVNFTFDQSLTVSLSSADIVINNLAPGSSSDSNVIDINVLSNNLSGYTLSSTVGDSTHTNPSYDNTNLNHTSNSSNTFTSLSPSDSIPDLSTYDTSGLTNPNVWGYSYSLDNSTWSNYSGLPKYNDATDVATLRTSTSPSSETGDDTYFKIAAKASATLAPGEYRNVINFTVTAEHNPVSFYDAFKEAATKDPTVTTLNGYYKMQDMTADICSNIYTSQLDDNTDTMEAQLIDIRDNNIYWVAKLKDGHCWMTQGLGLDLQHDNILTHETSDIGWTENNPNKIWNPGEAANTIEFSGLRDGDVVEGWGESNDSPYSASPYGGTRGDDVYVVSSGSTNNDVVYASLQACMSDNRFSGLSVIAGTGEGGRLSGAECSHYKAGNYYNFAAVSATNSIAGTMGHTITEEDDYTMMPDSICPAGWRAPHGLLVEPTGVASPNNSEFDTLLYAYGVTSRTGVDRRESLPYTNNGSTAIRTAPLYFIRPGYIGDNALHAMAATGYSWTGTISGAAGGYRLDSTATYVFPAGMNLRKWGFPVRCLAR